MKHAHAARILNVNITADDLISIVGRALEAIESKRETMVVACANPHSLVAAYANPEFLSALRNASVVLPDGVGVVLASWLQKSRIRARITGWDFFYALMGSLSIREASRVFFVGSTPGVIESIRVRLATEFPSITVCGYVSPPFGSWPRAVDQGIIAAIEEAKPDVLWVGMTAPKQEMWVERNRADLKVPVIASVGAVFDFYARTVPRAPVLAQRIGLEWLFRLVRNPRRLWQRTVVSAPRFFSLILQHRVLGAERE